MSPKLVRMLCIVAMLSWAGVMFAQYDRYIWETNKTVNLNVVAVQPLIEKLRGEVDRITAAGHLAPLRMHQGDVKIEGAFFYWEPGRIITTLAMAYPYMDAPRQQAIRTYVNAELATDAYRPWTTAGNFMPPFTGARREYYVMNREWSWTWFWAMEGSNRAPTRIATLYGLWLYAYNSGDWSPVSSNWTAIKNFYSSRSQHGNIYGTMSAHIAMARMAHYMNDAAMVATATNNAQTYFNQGLNFATIENNARTYYSYMYSTPGRAGDVYHGWMFINLVPEVGRYLREASTALRDAVLARHNSGKAKYPLWWLYKAPYWCWWIWEEGIGLPVEMVGMISPVERWVARASSATLMSYLPEVRMVGIGDCYNIESLIDTISSFGTDTWQDVRSTGPANVPPTCILTSPVTGSTYTAPATVNLAATATDSDGSVVSVAFYRGTTVLFTDSSSPYSYTWTGVSSGTYQLSAVATDNQGATGMSAVVTITVVSTGLPPNQPPTISLTSPVNGSTYTAPATVNLASTATDPDGSIAAVRFYHGTTLLNLDTASPYAYTWTGVSSGTYQLYATATDNQGAVSTSAVVSVTVYPPNQPPAVTMTSPVNGSTYTAPATLNLAATANDSDGSIANVRFYRGTTLLATDTASPYEYTWANVSSGTYQLRAVAQDNQGATSTSTIVTVTVLSSSTPAVWYTLTTAVNPANGGTVNPASGTYLAGSQIQVTATPNTNYTFANWSGDASGTNPTITLTMDADKSITANFTSVPPANSSPTVSITSPNDGATYTAPASITITATAADSDGTIAAVRFYSGMTLLNTDSASPYSYTWTGVSAGSYVLTAQAQDNQGAVGTSAAVGITVSAQPMYYTLTVTANPSNGGTVNQIPSGASHLAGTQVSLTATPNAGYEFTGWTGDITGSSTTNPTVVVMDANKTLTANFRQLQGPQPSLQPGEVRIVGGIDGYINATTNPNVTIRFRRTIAGTVTVRIYDLRGRLVMERSKDGPAGIDDDIAWNTAELPAGVYIVRVKGGGVKTSRKAVILR